MDSKPKARPLLLFFGALTLLALMAFGLVYALVRVEAARWPTLAETPPVTAPTQPERGDGRAFEGMMAAVAHCPAAIPELSEAIDVVGRPSADALTRWEPVEPCVARLRVALRDTRGLVVPQPARLDEPGPDLLPFLRLARAWLLEAWSLAEAGEPARGLHEILQVRDLGVRFMQGDSGLVGVMVGIVVSNTASRELSELLAAHGAATPTLCAQAAAGLAPIEPGAVARALAVEARLLEGMLSAQRDVMSTAEALGYDEEVTRVWHRQAMQRAVDSAGQPRWERPAPDPRQQWETEGSVIQLLHNRTGRTLLSLTWPNHDRFVDREDAAVASGRLDALEVAARRYALDHGGALPPDQAALVPAYLPAPLLDPYDGELLRLAEGSAWSIGDTQLPPDDPTRLRRAL